MPNPDLWRLLVATAVAAAAPVRAQRPAIPAGGLPLRPAIVADLTYGDGYRTIGELLLPTGGPPGGGWPLLVFVHGLGGSRRHDEGWRRDLAGHGFAVWSYDVRGQGDAMALNPPSAGSTLWGAAEKADLAEQIAFVRASFAAEVDPARVGVAGSSQGGVHAWFAAAHSGGTIAAPGRGSVPFPRIDAVVARAFTADPLDERVRDGTQFGTFALEVLSGSWPLGLVVDEGVREGFQTAFEAQDPAGYLAALRAEPGRPLPSLQGCAVPILYLQSYHDAIAAPRLALERLAELPATTPRRVVVSTNDHGTPFNRIEEARQWAVARRWFERFLWGEDNGVESEAPFVLGLLPLDGAQRGDPEFTWGHRFAAGVGADPTALRLYPRDDGVLTDVAPSAGSGVIDHRVDPAYTPSRYLAEQPLRDTAALLRHVPLAELVFASAPLAAESWIVATPVVRLTAVPSAAHAAIAATLSVRPPGGAAEVMMTSRGRAVLGAVPGQPLAVELELSPVAAALPAGSVVVLRLRNLWLRDAPQLGTVETAPLFTPFTWTVLLDGSSHLDLPFAGAAGATVATPDYAVDVAAPLAVPFAIRAGAARAGATYLLAASGSGQTPGVALPGGVLPIRLDEVTVAFVQATGAPELAGFFGTLDAAGSAAAVFDLPRLAPLPPDLHGARLSFAAWILTGGGLDGVPTDAVDLRLY